MIYYYHKEHIFAYNNNHAYNEDFFNLIHRALAFGDGVFETITILAGKLLFIEKHLERLWHGLDALQINNDDNFRVVFSDWLKDIVASHYHKLQMSNNNAKEFICRVQLFRHADSRGYLPVDERENPLIYLTFRDMPHSYMSAEIPKDLILYLSKWRRPAPDILPAGIKSCQAMPSIMAMQEAKQLQTDLTKQFADISKTEYEPLMLDYLGNICEAASGNIFWQKNNMLYTPALGHGAVAGVMRDNIIALWPGNSCADSQIANSQKGNIDKSSNKIMAGGIIEGDYALDDIIAADALVMTNASYIARPVIGLRMENGQKYEFAGSRALAKEMREAIVSLLTL